MYQLHTEKQRLYFNEVIRLHYEEGMGEDRISRSDRTLHRDGLLSLQWKKEESPKEQS